MGSTVGVFRIDGVDVPPPVENQEITIEAFFGSDNIQPKVSPLEFTFINEAAKTINDYVDAGNIFQGLTFDASVIGDAGNIQIIDGYLDLANRYDKISPIKIKTEAKFLDGIGNLDKQLKGITFDLLVEENIINNSDYTRVRYVVEKPINAVELVITSVTLFLLIKELAENTEKLGEDINTALGMLSTSATGGIGAVIYQIAMVLVRAAYIAILLKSIIDLVEDLISNFISQIYIKNALSYRVALEKIFAYLGYRFESPIEDLDYLTYVPSNNSTESRNGVPNPGDFGYNVDAYVSMLLKQFRARIANIDGTIHFRALNDPFWLKNSTYVMDDVLLEDNYSEKKNTQELIKSKIVEFLLDSQDDWTRDNYLGTNYTVITQHIEEVDQRKDALKGFERVTINVSFGNRKDRLNPLEETLKILAGVADTITGIFGANQHFAQRIKNRVGMMKVSGETWSNPKMIYWDNDQMPVNHRDLTSAKYFYENFISYDSFVLNDFKRQREFYEGVEVGFGLSDFIETNKNSYFTTPSGKIGKFVNIKWNFNKDRATVDFWIEDDNPSKKIKEIYIETE